jgi:formate/nitrite transporter FocA (FNT family)
MVDGKTESTGKDSVSADKEQAGKTSGQTQSGKLNDEEKGQAAEHSSPRAKVIHEIVRDEGEEELARSTSAIVLSGLTAGLSMGFSFLAMALIQSDLPDAPYRSLISGPGYCLGFVIAVLGKHELFTESTLTAVLPVLVRRDLATMLALARFWALVLVANLFGTFIYAELLSINGLFAEPVQAALKEIAHQSVSGAFLPTLVKSILAGWLIALMVWLLPSAKSARLFVIILLTYVVAIGHFSHIIAGSVEAFYAVITGDATIGSYLVSFLLPTLIGNTIGGVALVALLNHAPLAPELRD